MNWRFWLRSSSFCDDCARIEPLLSLESDGMASPEETRRIAAHLESCPACRQTRDWMLATRQVVAARALAEPPFDMRARIARAIAENNPSPVPVSARPAPRRPLVLRPAFAGAMTTIVVALIGVGVYQLTETNVPNSPTPVAVAVHPTPTVKIKPPVVKTGTKMARVTPENSSVKKSAPSAKPAPPILTANADETPSPEAFVAPAPRRETPISVKPSVKPSISASVKVASKGNNKPNLTTPKPTPVSVPPEKVATKPAPETVTPSVSPTPAPETPPIAAPQTPVTVASRDVSSEIRLRLTAQQGARPARTIAASSQPTLRSAAFSSSELDSSNRNPGSGTADIVHAPGF